MNKYSQPLKLICVFLLAFSLTACFGPSLKTSKNAPITQTSYWKAKGKISVNVDGKRESAYFTWANTGEDYTLRFHSIFGTGGVHINRVNGKYILTHKDEEQEAESPEALMQSQLGWSIPISNMEYWIRGVRSPHGSKPLSYLPDNAIHQDNWLITYPKQRFADGYLVPEKMLATYKNIKLTVVINSWDLDE